MNIFGRKRYLARQEARAEALADAYRDGLADGQTLCECGYGCPVFHRPPDPSANRLAATRAGLYDGWVRMECDIRDAADQLVLEAEEICRLALPPGWDGSAQDVHGQDEAA
jgi:hypothetical protein